MNEDSQYAGEITLAERVLTPDQEEMWRYVLAHPHCHEPAKFFEDHTGITGIAGHYHFPDDPRYTRDALEAMTADASVPQHEVAAALEAVFKENPGLKEKLRYDDTNAGQQWDALRGIMSGFNADDINYFIARSDSGKPQEAERHKMQDALSAVAMKSFGKFAQIGWVASPGTLEVISTELQKRPEVQALIAGFEQQTTVKIRD